MDHLFVPKYLDIPPSHPEAEEIFLHWKANLENCLEFHELNIPDQVISQDDMIYSQLVASLERKRRFVLVGAISHTLFYLVYDTSTFSEAISILDNAYIKPRNIVYNRYKLLSCKQETGQSIDNYVLKLQQCAKYCQFKQVTAEEYKNEFIRDAFINGIKCSHIRQTLLTQLGNLTLEQAFSKAQALEHAKKQPAYLDSTGINAFGELHDTSNLSDDEDHTTAENPKHRNIKQVYYLKNTICYFCGNDRHNRSTCPARNVKCTYCHKRGHMERACRSKQPPSVDVCNLSYPIKKKETHMGSHP